MSKEFAQTMEVPKLHHETFVPYSLEQNRFAERKNCIMVI
jgi:hypothetical protein